jgi:hypothetical protein
MSSSPLTTVDMLFFHLVDVEDVPADVQRTIAARAGVTGDIPLLVSLAARLDAPDDVLDLVAARPEAKVRCAYLSRADHDADTLARLIAKEKRATVLAAVAANEDASPDLLDALSHDSRRAVVFALLENVNTPPEAKVRAARTGYSMASKLGYSQAGTLTRAVLATAELHDEIVATRQDELRVFSRLAASTSLSEASQNVLVDELVDHPIAAAATIAAQASSMTATRHSTPTWRLNSLCDMAATAITELARNPSVSLEVRARLAVAFARLEQMATPGQLASARAALAENPLDETPRQRLVRIARDSTDPDELSKLAEALPTPDGLRLNQNDLHAVAAALCHNPQLPPAGFVAALKMVAADAFDAILKSRATNAETMAAVATQSPYTWQSRAGVADVVMAASGTVGLVELVEQVHAAGLDRKPQASKVFASCVKASGYDPLVLDAVPFVALAGVCQHDSSAASALSARLAPVLAVPGARELFCVLGSTFDGSLADLVSTVGDVSELS